MADNVPAKILTKSRFLIGLQCPKYLWVLVNQPEKIPEPDLITQHRFEQGHLIGNLAKKFFGKGIDIPTENFNKNIEQTANLLKKREILFEAGILAGNIYARADVLLPAGTDAWDIIEVKSAADVKDEHIDDVAFQKFCYEKFGLKIRGCFLMHVNTSYVKKGELNLKELFKIQDITEKVNAIPDIDEKAKTMLKIISSKKCPETLVGAQCRKPSQCPIEICWDFLPEHDIFELYGKGKLVADLFEKGIYAIKDIPDEFELTDKQGIQRECAKTKKAFIKKQEITRFLASFEYPIHYLDFETFGLAVPIFDGTKPYQNIPFQFSLHLKKDAKTKAKHYAFLADSPEDPRLKFLESLKKAIEEKGSIIAFNAHFEKNTLRQLAADYPQYNKWVQSILPRFIDLITPFRNFWYYDSEQHGSCSLKEVLPALTGKSYEGMDIAEGGMASYEYLRITYGIEGKLPGKKEIAKVRKNLEKYCALDTEAMLLIVDKLNKISKA